MQNARVNSKKVLFISGSVGLGHAARDLEIAKALRKLEPNVEVSWLAEDPASRVLVRAGENLLPEARLLAHSNAILDNIAKAYSVNMIRWVAKMREGWSSNVRIIAEVIKRRKFDLVVGDETYDLIVELGRNPAYKNFPFVIIYDFIGLDCIGWHPMDKLVTYAANRSWAKALEAESPLIDKTLFIGVLEDVLDKPFGFGLPNRREVAAKSVDFVGYVLPFEPGDFQDKMDIRKTLGYGDEPLIVCSIGGTSVGKSLLELCVKTYPLLKRTLGALRMVLVCGPLLKPDTIHTPAEVEVRGYVPELYKHFAAADLCIISGGGTTTLELTALKRPFLYFPIKQHFEQEVYIPDRCQRLRAGVKMNFSATTPELLAEAALTNLGKHADFASIQTNGANKAAFLIDQILNKNS